MEQSAPAQLPWPWQASIAPRRFEVSGDVVEAAEMGLGASIQAVAYHSCQLVAGLPLTVYHRGVWKVVEQGVEFSIDSANLKLSQTFIRDEDGRLVVDFGLLRLAPVLQGHGYSKLMLRSAVPIYDMLGVSHIVAYANYEVGGYAWAKLGAVALAPDAVREQMMAKLEALSIDEGDVEQLAPVRAILSDAHDDDLMRELAAARRVDGRRVGKDLLMYFGWEAVWDLSDQQQRAALAVALS